MAGGGEVIEKAAEGEYRSGPYCLDGGWLSAKAGRLMNWWQAGYSLQPYSSRTAIVEACVSAYAQTVAMCPGDHWRSTGDGGRERVNDSPLARILRKPNDYESISDLLVNLIDRHKNDGSGYAILLRGSRFDVEEMHLMRRGEPVIADDGSIFYWLSGNEVVDRRVDLRNPIPARDVLHLRTRTPLHPLKGVSPLCATVLEQALSGAALNQQVAFYLNQARPSFMLSTDTILNKAQADDLRARWIEQTTGEHAGGTPILTAGLKAQPVGLSAHDSQIAELLKWDIEAIAMALRVPLAILGVGGGVSFASSEMLYQSWLGSGLGYELEHVEQAFDRVFGLRGWPYEYTEFDTKALLRSAFKDRIEGLVRGVQGGVYVVNEARAEEELPAKEFGDEPRLQEQMVPLSYGAAKQPPPIAPPAPPPSDEPGDDDDADAANRAIRAYRASRRDLSLAA